jgi:hypothetical protein
VLLDAELGQVIKKAAGNEVQMSFSVDVSLAFRHR